MKPNNFNDDNCESKASDCVIWSGAYVECINLKPGDTITKAVYVLATELCTVMDQLNISNYDLKCLTPIGCAPLDFKGLINLLITKVCANG